MDMEVNKGEELVVVGLMIGLIRWFICLIVGLVNNRSRDSFFFFIGNFLFFFFM